MHVAQLLRVPICLTACLPCLPQYQLYEQHCQHIPVSLLSVAAAKIPICFALAQISLTTTRPSPRVSHKDATMEDYYPISNNRDLGFGFNFYPQSYTDPDDGKTYRWETFVPRSGYCPGCNITHRSGCFTAPRSKKRAKHSHSDGPAIETSKYFQDSRIDTMMADTTSLPHSDSNHEAAPTLSDHHIPSSSLDVSPNDAFFDTTSANAAPLQNDDYSPTITPAKMNFPQKSSLVYAVTVHAGPSESCLDSDEEDQEWLEWEYRRIARLRRMLKRWADEAGVDRGG